MKWKTLPYWLRGGLIGLLIFTLLWTIPLLFGEFLPDLIGNFYTYLALSFIILALILRLPFGCETSLSFGGYSGPSPAYCDILSWVFILILGVLIPFLLGALIGFIIQKIKKN